MSMDGQYSNPATSWVT